MTTKSLIDVYRKAIYTVPEFETDITIDRKNPELDKALKAQKVKSWVFITADNPHSNMRTSAENTRAFLQLEEMVKATEHVYYEAWAKSIRNDWPPEHALLIVDIPMEEAMKIAREFTQKAVVAGDVGKSAKVLEV